MIHPLLAAACLSLALMLGGCQLLDALPFGSGAHEPRLHGAAEARVQPVMYLGDEVGFTILQKSTIRTTCKIEFVHLNSEASRSYPIAFSKIESHRFPLVASELPGYSEDSLNRYRLSVSIRDDETPTDDGQRVSMDFGQEFVLVKDREIQLSPPKRPDTDWNNPTLWTPAGTLEDVEALAMEIASSDWRGQGVTLSSLKLENEWNSQVGVPGNAEVWQVVATGEFPRYVVTRDHNRLGRDALMKPNKLWMVLSRSAPVHVISVLAEEDPRETP